MNQKKPGETCRNNEEPRESHRHQEEPEDPGESRRNLKEPRGTSTILEESVGTWQDLKEPTRTWRIPWNPRRTRRNRKGQEEHRGTCNISKKTRRNLEDPGEEAVLTLTHAAASQGLLGTAETQLPAYHTGRLQVPAVVAHCPPLIVLQHLNPALAWPGSAFQPHVALRTGDAIRGWNC